MAQLRERREEKTLGLYRRESGGGPPPPPPPPLSLLYRGVERHQEVITIGLKETGTEVTLSHVLPPFHSPERKRDSGCVQ